MSYSLRIFKPEFRESYNTDTNNVDDLESLRVDSENGLQIKEGMSTISSINYNSVEPPVFNVSFYAKIGSAIYDFFYTIRKYNYSLENYTARKYDYLNRVIRMYRNGNVINTGFIKFDAIKFDLAKNKIEFSIVDVLSAVISTKNRYPKGMNYGLNLISDCEYDSATINLPTKEIFENNMTRYLKDYPFLSFSKVGTNELNTETPNGDIITIYTPISFSNDYDLKCSVNNYDESFYQIAKTEITGTKANIGYIENQFEPELFGTVGCKFVESFTTIRTNNINNESYVFFITFLKGKNVINSTFGIVETFISVEISKYKLNGFNFEYIETRKIYNETDILEPIYPTAENFDEYIPFNEIVFNNIVLNEIGSSRIDRFFYDKDLPEINESVLNIMSGMGINTETVRNGYYFAENEERFVPIQSSDGVNYSVMIEGSDYFKYGYTDIDFNILGGLNLSFLDRVPRYKIFIEGNFSSKKLKLDKKATNAGGQPYIDANNYEIVKTFLFVNNMYVTSDKYGDLVFNSKISRNETGLEITPIEIKNNALKFDLEYINELFEKMLSDDIFQEYSSILNSYSKRQYSKIKNSFKIKCILPKDYVVNLNDVVSISSTRLNKMFDGMIAGYRCLNGNNLYELIIWEVV